MARKSPHEKHKPEIIRLLSEGFKVTDIIKIFLEKGVKLPKATLYDWQSEFRNLSGNGGRIPMPIDPESPMDKIIQALWDLHGDPTQDGANIKLQSLQALTRAEQAKFGMVSSDNNEESPSDLEISVTRRIIHADD